MHCFIMSFMTMRSMLLVLVLVLVGRASAQGSETLLLVERFNRTTGPPRGCDIWESDEQGMTFPDDLMSGNRSALTNIRGRMAYEDGSGHYVGSDEVHHYASGVKCWSDYFVVDSGYWWAAWHKASGNIYCTGTSTCSIQHMDGHQTCETWSISMSSGVKNAFVNFAITLGYDHQTCHSGTDVNACIWSDQNCHCIWTQQQMSYQHGYKRRRCSSSHGDYTAWMQDVVHDAPTAVVNYGCGSKCTDT